MNFSFLRRLSLPLTLGAVAITALSSCDANVRFDIGRGHDRTWYGDPYCRNSWDYGCGYDRWDRDRIRIVFDRRNRGGWDRRWGSVDASTVAATSRPTSWEKEFNLKPSAVRTLKNAFTAAIDGNTSGLRDLGMGKRDIYAMSKFRMPSNEAINSASRKLGVKAVDLRDFTEVFMIRMKTGLRTQG